MNGILFFCDEFESIYRSIIIITDYWLAYILKTHPIFQVGTFTRGMNFPLAHLDTCVTLHIALETEYFMLTDRK